MDAPSVEPAPPAPPSWRELGAALVLGVLLLAALGAVTGRLEPTGYFYDEKVYLKMAVEGVGAVKPVTAPFPYRPGVTLLAGLIARVARVAPDRAFAGLAAVALALLLAALYALARSHTASRWRAAVATLLAALSYSAVKRLVFDPIGPDALGLLLTTVGCLLAVRRRYGLLLALTAVGVTCREFVILPAVAVAIADRRAVGWRGPRSLWPLAPVAAGALVALAVRLAIHVDTSTQNLDPLAPQTWRHALQVFDGRWLVNDVGAIAAFLWPLALLPWRPAGAAGAAPAPRLPAFAAAYGVTLFGVTLFAGTNFTWFAGYFAPLLVVAWALKAPRTSRWLDLWLVALVLVVNRTLEPIPQPRDYHAYVGFMSFYAADLDAYTAMRLLVVGAAVVAFRALFALWRERQPAPP